MAAGKSLLCGERDGMIGCHITTRMTRTMRGQVRKIRRLAKAGLAAVGYKISRTGIPNPRRLTFSPTWTRGIQEIADKVRPFTMTSADRVAALCLAIEYILRRGIPGDVVECGVWKGGSSMAAAWSLLHGGDTSRTLHLFDTFEGMPPPADMDLRRDGVAATEIFAAHHVHNQHWIRSPLEEVKTNLALTGYPVEKIKFIQGKVEETIPAASPDKIAVLRLDTDWYESTKHELEHLYPLLSEGGVLIVNDYGFWQGARHAVDEYFAERQLILLNRIDNDGQISVKA